MVGNHAERASSHSLEQETVNVGSIESLHTYPLKSAKGTQHQELEILSRGPKGDREWMIRTPEGKFLSQRTHPGMALVVAALNESNGLILGEGDNQLEVAEISGDIVDAEVWRTDVRVVDQGDEAAAWVQAMLGLSEGHRLVKRTDEYPRQLSQTWIDKPEGEVSLADGYPVLLTNAASLVDLNKHLEYPVTMDRFRANIVVSDFPAWDEDSWKVIQIGEVIFDVVKPCARCPIPGIDQETGERPDPNAAEPLKTLVKVRGADQVAESAGTDEFKELKGGFFGWNLVPRNEGKISVTDKVVVLERR